MFSAFSFSDVSEVFYSGAIYGASAVVFEDMIGMQVIHNYEVSFSVQFFVAVVIVIK